MTIPPPIYQIRIKGDFKRGMRALLVFLAVMKYFYVCPMAKETHKTP